MNPIYLGNYLEAEVIGIWMICAEYSGYGETSPEDRTSWYAFARKEPGRFILIEHVDHPESAKIKKLTKPDAYRIAYKHLESIPYDLEPAQYIVFCDPATRDVTDEYMDKDDAFAYNYVDGGLDGIVGVVPTDAGWSLAYWEYNDVDCKPETGRTYVYSDKTGEKLKIRFDGNRFEIVTEISNINTIKDLCDRFGLTQAELSRRFDIPHRSVQDWCSGRRNPPSYLIKILGDALSASRTK